MRTSLTYEEQLQMLIDKSEGVSPYSWDELIDELGLDISSTTLRKSWNNLFGGYSVMKYLEDKDMASSPDSLKELKDELYKERVRLQDVNRENRRGLREEGRYERLVEVLKKEMQDLEPIKLAPYNQDNEYDDHIYGVACFSDWHYGALIDNQWNYYDTEVAKSRANKLVDKILYHSAIHGVTDLIIEINGDMIEGEIMVSVKTGAEEDTIQQIIHVSELLAQCINKLRPYFNSIKIVTTLGNHGRLGYAPKNSYATQENFEMLIPEFLRLRLNMPIHSSHGLDFTEYEIGNKMVCVSHGQHDKMSTIIADFAQIYKRVPDEVHIGHLHQPSDKNDCDTQVVVNGSLVGSGDFSLQCRKVTKPSQTMIVYDVDRCVYNLEVE